MRETVTGELKDFFKEVFFVSDRNLVSKNGEVLDITGWKIYKCFLFHKADIEAIEMGDQDTLNEKSPQKPLKGGSLSLAKSMFSPRAHSKDPQSIEFWIGFELKMSSFITQMNNNNPATVPKPNNPVFITPTPKDCALSVSF